MSNVHLPHHMQHRVRSARGGDDDDAGADAPEDQRAFDPEELQQPLGVGEPPAQLAPRPTRVAVGRGASATAERPHPYEQRDDRGPRARAWVFTWNNYKGDTAKFIASKLEPVANYFVMGEEVGMEGTPHLQGYFMLKSPATLKQLKNKLGAHPHMEIARNNKKAIEYCKKDGKYIEWGTEPNQGGRSDLQVVAQRVVEGEDLGNIAREHADMFVKYHNGLYRLQIAIQQPYEGPRDVTWIWGASGSGKSVHAAKLAAAVAAQNSLKVFKRQGNTLWYDGYACEKVIIFDELRVIPQSYGTTTIGFQDLLALLGDQQHRVQIKGSTVPWMAKHIYITTIQDPFSVTAPGEEQGQLIRRISKVIHMKAPARGIRMPEMEELEPWDVRAAADGVEIDDAEWPAAAMAAAVEEGDKLAAELLSPIDLGEDAYQAWLREANVAGMAMEEDW